MVACVQTGLQTGFHTIGDGAIEAVVAGFEEAAARVGKPAIRSGRHRLEHVEMADMALIARLAGLGVYASVQPAFDAQWGGDDGMYAQRLGTHRARTLNPFASLAAAGITSAFGSDSPITPIDPWGTVRAAVFHHVPAQRLPLEVAFAAHTVGGWRAASRDDAGQLLPGAPATLVVWHAQTPLDPSRLPHLRPNHPLPQCLRTVVRGRTVYRR